MTDKIYKALSAIEQAELQDEVERLREALTESRATVVRQADEINELKAQQEDHDMRIAEAVQKACAAVSADLHNWHKDSGGSITRGADRIMALDLKDVIKNG